MLQEWEVTTIDEVGDLSEEVLLDGTTILEDETVEQQGEVVAQVEAAVVEEVVVEAEAAEVEAVVAAEDVR